MTTADRAEAMEHVQSLLAQASAMTEVLACADADAAGLEALRTGALTTYLEAQRALLDRAHQLVGELA